MKRLTALIIVLCIAVCCGAGLAEDVMVIGEGNMLPLNESSICDDVEIQISDVACAGNLSFYYADTYHKVLCFNCLIRNWGFDTIEVSTENWYLEYQNAFKYNRIYSYNYFNKYGVYENSFSESYAKICFETDESNYFRWYKKDGTLNNERVMTVNVADGGNGYIECSKSKDNKKNWSNPLTSFTGYRVINVRNGEKYLYINEKWDDNATYNNRKWGSKETVSAGLKDELDMLEEINKRFIIMIPNRVAEHALDGELVLHMFINDVEYQVCFITQ